MRRHLRAGRNGRRTGRAGGLLTWLRRLGGDRSGAAAILVALSMPVLAGGMGLGAEVGFHYLLQRNLQQAADLAAHAGVVTLKAGGGQAAIQAAARHIAARSGFDPAQGTLAAHTPPLAGPLRGNTSSVEVRLSMSQPRFFSGIFVDTPVTISARAVATLLPATFRTCLLALSPTEAHAIEIHNNAVISLPNCNIVSNSNASDAFLMKDSQTRLTVSCIRTVGAAVRTTNTAMRDCAAPIEKAAPVGDPYADVIEPPVEGACITENAKRTTTVFQPNFIHSSGVPALRICGGLDITQPASFKPGLYIIDDGPLMMNASPNAGGGGAGGAATGPAITGTGVTFLLANGATLNLIGAGSIDLKAPTTGPFAGVLFFGSRTRTGIEHVIGGNFSAATQGAIYAPASKISIGGFSSSINGCTQIIAATIEFSGSATLQSDCNVSNVRDVKAPLKASIAE